MFLPCIVFDSIPRCGVSFWSNGLRNLLWNVHMWFFNKL